MHKFAHEINVSNQTKVVYMHFVFLRFSRFERFHVVQWVNLRMALAILWFPNSRILKVTSPYLKHSKQHDLISWFIGSYSFSAVLEPKWFHVTAYSSEMMGWNFWSMCSFRIDFNLNEKDLGSSYRIDFGRIPYVSICRSLQSLYE